MPPNNDKERSEYPIQGKAPPARSDWQGRLLDIPDPAREGQREAPDAKHDDGGRHPQWPSLSSHARAGRPKKPLAQGEQKAARSRGRRRRRHGRAGDQVSGRRTRTQGSGRSAEDSRRRPEGAGVVVRDHSRCAQRLDPVDYLRQAARDTRASDRQCLRDARGRETTRLLLRSVRVL